MKLWPCGFQIEYTHLGFALAGAVWLGIWNSDHVVLKSSIHTSALPRRQQSHWGLRVTQNAYILLLIYTKQLLLVTFCSTLAGIEVSVRTHRRNEQNERTEPWTDGRGSWNSYLDAYSPTTIITFQKKNSDGRRTTEDDGGRTDGRTDGRGSWNSYLDGYGLKND